MKKIKTWEGREQFRYELKALADDMKVAVGAVRLRPMSRKWASITSDGKTLSFNDELLGMDKKLGKYVMVHELIHLKVPNHGKLFKSLLMVYVRDYKDLEKKLKSYNNKTKMLTNTI